MDELRRMGSTRRRIEDLEEALRRLQEAALIQERAIIDLQRYAPDPTRYGFLRMAERVNPRVQQGSPPVDCPKHKPVQHRDGRPPWCNKCGLTAAYQDPGPKLGERINPKVET